MKRTQNKWVVRAQVGAIAIFLLSVLVVMGYPVRSILIRRAEMPVFKSLEQDLNGFDTSGAINSAIPVPASRADWILLQPYYLSDDMSHHPELVGVVPQYVAEHLMWKNTVEMPLLIGFRDGVLIDAAHINGEYQLSGVLMFRHGDLLSLDRTSGVIQVSVMRQSMMTPTSASSHTEYLLGFTARPLPRDLDQEWPRDRRQTFLLNENAPEPTSVDAAGCAKLSCVDSQTAETLGTTNIHCDVPLHRSGTPPGASSLAIWASQQTLIDFLTPHLGPPSQRRYALHAITLLSKHPVHRTSHDWAIRHSSDSASSLDPSWLRLGFDIADIWLCSGLMNCGYTPSDRSHAARFIPRLNRFHLFDDAALALDFARFTDQRVDEHAPFHVFGMYQFQVR